MNFSIGEFDEKQRQKIDLNLLIEAHKFRSANQTSTSMKNNR